jgi:hypothetical protein
VPRPLCSGKQSIRVNPIQKVTRTSKNDKITVIKVIAAAEKCTNKECDSSNES